jgi:antitoxin ParD1/3/4
MRMTITLTPEQLARLGAYVARGDFPSIEEAARQLIEERITEREAEEGDDFAWARPYVEEARADIADGNLISLDEHEARTEARLAAMAAGERYSGLHRSESWSMTSWAFDAAGGVRAVNAPPTPGNPRDPGP